MDLGPGPSCGALPTDEGTWFSVEAPNAKHVDLCLFTQESPVEDKRLRLENTAQGIHRVFVAGVGPGQLYGYRVAGPCAGGHGRYFNPNKLLLDPWARQVAGPLHFQGCQRTFNERGGPDGQDSAQAMLRSVVQPRLDAIPVHDRPQVAAPDTVLYECHVRGMTARHPDVPLALRGTFLGLCQRPIIEHLQLLSVTSVSLMPVAACFVEEHLVAKGLTNYWGYAPVAAFAPDPRFATLGGDPVSEFRQMVQTFHQAGLEVIIDVVFNHTGEGDDRGATLSLRGLDHDSFFAVSDDAPHVSLDYTGCGNSLDLSSPTCLRYVMDVLRYWATQMGVDGFRFDLATTLARGPHGFDPHAPFLAAITQDPVLRALKLIAEPWDLGIGGYRLGGFPTPFAEWNDRYRDGVRRYFRGDHGSSAELATRISGSSDFFGTPARGPAASVNYITSHDGFSLWDLVSYAHAHNDANGENGMDGHSENLSQNYGIEGESEDAEIVESRLTTMRSMLLCLAMSHGTPMLSHGDELGRSQAGNNNTYCQDNELTHLDWSSPRSSSLLTFVRTVFGARARHPCLRPLQHMHGDLVSRRPDISWWRADGQRMNAADWNRAAFAVRVCGQPGDSVLVLFNAADTPRTFALPTADIHYGWVAVADGAHAASCATEIVSQWTVAPRATALLEQWRNA